MLQEYFVNNFGTICEWLVVNARGFAFVGFLMAKIVSFKPGLKYPSEIPNPLSFPAALPALNSKIFPWNGKTGNQGCLCANPDYKLTLFSSLCVKE